jgi:hypothetical protein
MVRTLRWLIWPILLIGLFLALAELNDGLWHRVGYSNHPLLAVVVLAAAVLALGVAAARLSRLKGHGHLIALLAVSAAFLGVSALSVWDARDAARRLVTDYCSYGATSNAQLDGCLSHISAGYVLRHHTRAARFATNFDADCGQRSGPFCGQVVARRVAEAIEP